MVLLMIATVAGFADVPAVPSVYGIAAAPWLQTGEPHGYC